MLCNTKCWDKGRNLSFGLVPSRRVKEINGYGEPQGKDHCYYNVYFTSSLLYPISWSGSMGNLPVSFPQLQIFPRSASMCCNYLAHGTEWTFVGEGTQRLASFCVPSNISPSWVSGMACCIFSSNSGLAWLFALW